MPDGWSSTRRVRCIGHIINLVVKVLLFGTEESRIQEALNAAGDDELFVHQGQLGIIGKLHNLCIYINRSAERRAFFRSLQTESQPELEVFYVLIADGGIRWHATHLMSNRAILLKDTIIRWQRQYSKGSGVDISSNFLTHEDFEALQVWQSILHDLKDLYIAEESNITVNTFGTVAGVLKALNSMSERLEMAESEVKSL